MARRIAVYLFRRLQATLQGRRRWFHVGLLDASIANNSSGVST